MSAAVLHFTPRAELSAQENLAEFIAACKASQVLDTASQFDRNVWEAGYTLKGKNHQHRVVFSTLEAASEATNEPAMPEPFLSFAKAALVYMHDKRAVVSQAVRLAAMRCLEGALRQCGKDRRPTAVDAIVLDTAVDLARRQFGAATAYRVAGQLEAIADLMREKGFITLAARWLHSVKKPRERDSRISEESLKARADKLPSAAALRGLGGVFQLAQGIGDTLISSASALMMCAPERVNEVVRLPYNCLVEGDGRFAGKLGIRWRGSKGAENTTKWLPTEMVPMARQAVERLQKASEEARRIVAWYSARPASIYVHEDARHLEGKERLTYEEVALLLWGVGGKAGSAVAWCRQVGIEQTTEAGSRRGLVSFAEVEHHVVAMLPGTFPHLPGDTGVQCKDALALMRKNELHPTRSPWMCMFDCIEQNDVALRLGGRPATSLFVKYDFKEDDGTPIVLTSHMFRHYLNMLAQIGGLSSAEIAIFSGRKDERQNRAYDHMTSDEVQAPIKRAIEGGFMGSLVPVEPRKLVKRGEFNGIAAAHTTEYGYCLHNFASEPCQMYRDCINCEEQECVKGDDHKEANLRKLKEETEYLLKQAQRALSEEEFGADLWVQHQTTTLERATEMLKVMEDPAVPPGARIRLRLDSVPLVANGAHPAAQPIPAGQKLKALR